MTIPEIRKAILRHHPMSKRTIYTHISALGVKPVGKVRTKPQRYPDDTPTRILTRLGINPKKGGNK
jgi:hypothetical protein